MRLFETASLPPKTNYFVQNQSRIQPCSSRMLRFVIGANSVESRHKHINLSRREFKMARKLDRVGGIDDANAR